MSFKQELQLELAKRREEMLASRIEEDEAAINEKAYMDYLECSEPEEYKRLMRIKG